MILLGRRAALEVLDEMRPQSLSSQDYEYLNKAKWISSIEDGKEKNRRESIHAKPYHIYRWTIFMPLCCLTVGYLAYKMSDKYGRLMIPHR